MELNVWTCETHHGMLQLTAILNSLAVDQCTPTSLRVTNLGLRFILFKCGLSYVTHVFHPIKRAQYATFNLNAKKLMVIETAVTD